MKINIKVDASDCKFNADELKARLSEALEYGAENVQRMAIEIVPKDTGDLAGSIEVSGGGLHFEIAPDTDYDVYIEEGTSPHTITGNYYLYWEGADHPVHEVNHPGNKAYKYMEEALMANIDNIVEFVMEAIGDIFD